MIAGDPDLLLAHDDAMKRGVGYVRIKRITLTSLTLARIDPSLVVVLDDPTSYLEQLRAQVLSLPCSTCLAAVGESCRTTSGRRTTFHVARSQPVYEAWRIGHRDGLVDAFRRLVNDWHTPAAELLKKHGAGW